MSHSLMGSIKYPNLLTFELKLENAKKICYPRLGVYRRWNISLEGKKNFTQKK